MRSGESTGWSCPKCDTVLSLGTRACPNDGFPIAQGFDPRSLIGCRIGEKLTLTEFIATGGFGHVYGAHHVETHGARVVKLLRPELAVDADTVQRFRREAQIAESLDHRAIVRIYDTGVIDGLPYIVMERVRGESLRALFLREGVLATERVVDIVRQVAEALDFAHNRHVIHRDLTPGNIVVRSGEGGKDLVTVIDFGLAKAIATRAVEGLTARHEAVGTAAYMSPEQLGLGTVDHRTDIFALAMVTIESIAGELPPGAGGELPDGESSDPYGVEQLSAAKSWPPVLREVLKRGIMPAKRSRFQSVQEFSTALMDATKSERPAVATHAPSTRATPIEHVDPEPDSAPRRHSRGQALKWSAGLITVAVMITMIAIQLSNRDSSPLSRDLEDDLRLSKSATTAELTSTNRDSLSSRRRSGESYAAPPVALGGAQGLPSRQEKRDPRESNPADSSYQSAPDASTPRQVNGLAEAIAALDESSRGPASVASRAIGQANDLMPLLTTLDDSVHVRLIAARASMSAGQARSACIELRALQVIAEPTQWARAVAAQMAQACQ